MRLAPGWHPWVLVPLVLALPLLVSGSFFALGPFFGAAFLILAAFCLWFFRDPERSVGEGIVAAADGRIQAVDGEAVTFLNLHDVHVVRAPFAGHVTAIDRVDGPRWPAFLQGAEKNGGVTITVETDWGQRRIELIAGMLARRAIPFVEEGQRLEKGQRIGMIRFGSRVDVDLPAAANPAVGPGDRVRAAETTIAQAPDPGDASR